MKKTVALLLAALMLGMLAGCSGNDEPQKEEKADTPVTETSDKEPSDDPVPENTPDNTETVAEDVITWYFDGETATLYIEGGGEMSEFLEWNEQDEEYIAVERPWEELFGKVERIEISEGITSVTDRAFSGFRHKSIAIPSTVASIGADAFSGCLWLESIEVADGNKNYFSEDGVLFGKDNTLIRYPCGRKQTEYKLPSGINTIGNGAFTSCRFLESVDIPEGVTDIGEYAFYSCEALKSVALPDGTASIGSEAFSGCSALASVSLPDSLTYIGEYAFYGCVALESIDIPEGVTTVGNEAFAYCEALETINFLGTQAQWEILGLIPDNLNNANVTFAK